MPTVAREAMRRGISDRDAAAMVNATLIDFGYITPARLRDSLNEDQPQMKTHVRGLYFDGKEVQALEATNEECIYRNVARTS